jgi:hypothetical protein
MTPPLPTAGAAISRRYRRPHRLLRAGAIALGAAGAVAIACSGGGASQSQAASEWVQTDGAAGRINLDDVRQAYKDSFGSDGFDVAKFEQAVNRIYEGDHIILVQVQQQGNQVAVSGWEDLNDNKQLDTSGDDKLFTITQDLRENSGYTVQGYGANGYYHESSPFSGFLPGFFLGHLLSGGRTTYITPPLVYDSLSSSRATFRSSSSYQQQKDRNAAYGSSVRGRYGSSVDAQHVSPARSSYQQRAVSSGGFRSSGSGSRSITGGKSDGGSGSKGGVSGGKSGGTSGGIKGGGGLMAL